VALLHLARVLAIPLLVVATYRFASRFIVEERWRRWATLLAVAGEGLGWLVLAAGSHASQPLELYSPETFGALALLTFPHLVLARACLLMGLDAYLEAPDHPRDAWRAATWFMLLVFVQHHAVPHRHPVANERRVAVVGDVHDRVVLDRRLLADAHEDFPRYPLDAGVPGNLPLLNFPEISMWGNWPWGGFGANPQPAYLPPWRNNEHFTLAGGFGLGYELNQQERCGLNYVAATSSSADHIEGRSTGCRGQLRIAQERAATSYSDLNGPLHPFYLEARFSLGVVF
jgi:hypothetical protein